MKFAATLLLVVLLMLPAANAQETSTLGTGYWHTSGNRILDADNQQVRIAGVNWFGLETDTYAPHGLWSRSYKDILSQIKALGYNTVRVPFSNQLFDEGSTPNGIDFSKNPDLTYAGGIEILDRIVLYAGTIGLKIILDRHRPDSAAQSSLWYTPEFPESRWISDWEMLATRYIDNPTVVGADLHNEPHGPVCWGCGVAEVDWVLAAQRAGNAILAKNPNWLIIVEGVEVCNGNYYWWGGNLMGVRDTKVVLSVPNRLVYSAHDYPRSLNEQAWFSDSTYPANLPAVWDSYWGFISKEKIAPVLMGEFGSKLETESDQQWFNALTSYLGTGVNGVNWLFWCLNPNSGDTGGLLLDDWLTVDDRKQSKLTPLQVALTGLAPEPVPIVTTPPTTGGGDTPTEEGSGGATVVPQNGAFCTATYKLWGEWDTGFSANAEFTNKTGAPLTSWTVTMTFDGGQTVREVWNAQFTQEGEAARITPLSWNANVENGQSILFGFVGDKTGTVKPPVSFQLNGFPCSYAP